MYIGLDAEGNRVYIDDTENNCDYFCPICKDKLVQRKGEIKQHHFAHSRNTQCEDTWHYDMSEWHLNWQNRFPVEFREVVKSKNGKTHRADVLIEDKKTVVEFQHSPLSSEEFDDRNDFYTSLGYKVVWVFDLTKEYKDLQIQEHEEKDNIYIYRWKHPKSTFDNYDYANKDIVLFFQFMLDANEDEVFREIHTFLEKEGPDSVDEDDLEYIRCHEDDQIYLVKVVWNAGYQFKWFAVEKRFYGEKFFLNQFIDFVEEEKKHKLSKEDLYDELTFLYSRDHSHYYFGCPRTPTHKCVDCSIDTPVSMYNEIMPCELCDKTRHSVDVCRYKFSDIQLSDSDEILSIDRNLDGFVTRVVIFRNGKEEIFSYPNYLRGKNVYELWKELSPNRAVFVNVRTGRYVKFIQNPIKQREKYGQCYGFLSDDQYEFPEESKEIYYADRPEWVCAWHR